MCTGMEGMALAGGLQMGGTLLSGLSQYQHSRTQADLARADAQTEREAAQRQAELIMRRTRQVQGAARAATAASGAAIDEWSMRGERDILAAGMADAEAAIISGKSRALNLETTARFQDAAAIGAIGTSLFQMGTMGKGWKGGMGMRTNDLSGVNGSNALDVWARSGVGSD